MSAISLISSAVRRITDVLGGDSLGPVMTLSGNGASTTGFAFEEDVFNHAYRARYHGMTRPCAGNAGP
jgi:hypothetical protein